MDVRNDSILIPNRALSLKNLGGLTGCLHVEKTNGGTLYLCCERVTDLPPGALDLCRILRFGQVAGGGAMRRDLELGELESSFRFVANDQFTNSYNPFVHFLNIKTWDISINLLCKISNVNQGSFCFPTHIGRGRRQEHIVRFLADSITASPLPAPWVGNWDLRRTACC